MRQLKRTVKIGNITIGGTNPIAVQTMLNVPVKDIAGNVEQAKRVAKAGCQIVRVTVPTPADAAVVSAIKVFAHTVVSKLHLNTQQLFEMLQNVLQGELVSRAFRTTEVRTDNYTTAIGQNLLQCRKSGTHTGIICNVEVFVQGYVEVHTNECLFSGKVKLINCHNTLFYLKVLLISF